MQDVKTSNTLKKFLRDYKIVVGVFAGLSAALTLTAVLFAVLSNEDYANLVSISCGSIALLLTLLLVFLSFIHVKKSKTLFYDQAYRISKHNIEALRDHSKLLRFYDNNDIEEFKDFNKLIHDLAEEYDSTTISVKRTDYEGCGINFISEDGHIVEYKSLRNNISKLILNTQAFRNAVIAFSYDLGDEKIKEKDAKEIMNLILKGLNYPNILIAFNDDKKGFLCFCPYFDSINQLNEELENLIQHISLIKRSLEGKDMVLCHVAVAVYPYSAVNDVMRDLTYAMKQTKLINFFIPDRPVRPNKDVLLSSMNLNNICKFYERFASLKPRIDDIEGSFKDMCGVITQVNNYYRFSSCGMLEYNIAKDAYVCTFASNISGRDIFQEGAVVRRKYIDALKRVSDKDGSYYFSNRLHINNDLVQFIDVYEMISGQFFIIQDGEKVVAVLYFLNFDKEISYDTYMRESLLVFSHFIGSFYKELHDKRSTLVTTQSFADVLKLSNTLLYTVNPDTHRIIFMSDAFKNTVPKAECGKQCFKAIYGLTAPCTECPLKNRRKHMIQKIRRNDYETSIAFRSLDENQCQMLVRPATTGFASRDRFDQDLLINTYYSFYDNLENEFVCRGEGYLLLMTIDNIDDIVKNGNKAYVYCLRDFGEKIRHLNDDIDVVYLYRDDILAMILPSADRHVLINTVEKIYDLSKQTKLKEDGEYFPLVLSYLAPHYTAGYPNVDEYLKYIAKVVVGSKKNRGQELLQFVNTSYMRKASREQHILELIDDALQDKSFRIKMQPIVEAATKRIYGAELLIRVDDKYRSQVLNASEVIQIAENYGRVPDISNSLINYIGNLYKTYGYIFFKSIGFDRLSMNTDFSYFTDKEFLDKINDLALKYSVPKNFLSLEITESDMYNSYEEFSRITQRVLSCNTTLVCDQYTGSLLSPEQIKELGFSEVKIARRLVVDIANDEQKLSRIIELYYACRKEGLRVIIVGVETREQFELLTNEIRDVYIQGNYFYTPLDEEVLLDELRKTNYYDDRLMRD